MSSTLAEMVRRYDRPGPRYTSYPTALGFTDKVSALCYGANLDLAAARPEALSLYLHLPFCEQRCLFCACNVVVTKKREVSARYLDRLEEEIRVVGRRIGRRRRLVQYHWGGGTPTYLSPDQIRRLHGVVSEHFTFAPDAEMAIEVDPRVTTDEHLETLRSIGFNRLSIGVQDFTPEVQQEIGRIQPFGMTERLVSKGRALGFRSTNLDLIYGLPRQTPETFRRSIEQVLRLRPERLAIYSYAHVPWMKGHQKKLTDELLPVPEVKLELFLTAIHRMREAGYVSIGMDHFALPDDELGRAATEGTLSRNFMGYTVKSAPDLLACGMSAISDLGGAFFQNERKLHAYEAAVKRGGLPTERGYLPTEDDRLRRYVITALMCNFHIDFDAVESRFDVDFAETFARELDALGGFEADGIVNIGPGWISVPESGRLFIRNVCMAFDAHLGQDKQTPRWSRTV